MDVMIFERHLEDNIFDLHRDLKNKTYRHGGYSHFIVTDNKKRNIHKAEVKDRIIHQIISDYLKNLFEPAFIADSYSSRDGKGTHKAVIHPETEKERIKPSKLSNISMDWRKEKMGMFLF